MCADKKSEDTSRTLVPYREPADMTALVVNISEVLKDLALKINAFIDQESLEINIESEVVEDITSSLERLNDERLWLHEAVESETIVSSVLRHKLGGFPRDVEGEIIDAVQFARKSNATTIKTCKEQLLIIENGIKSLEKKLEVLSASIVTLGPEKQERRSLHDEIIMVLNEDLMTKARMQIKLNETQRELNETHNCTRDFQQDCGDMSEDMVVEKQEASAQEKRIKSEIEKTLKEIDQQQKLNVIKKSEMKAIQAKQSKDGDLEHWKDNILHCEAICTRLEELYQQQLKQLEDDIAKRALLSHIGKSSVKEHANLQEAYCNTKERLEKDIYSLLSAKQLAQNEYDELHSQRIRTMNMLDASVLTCRKDKDEVEEMHKSLQVTKDDLLHQSSECTRLKRENLKLETQIEKTTQDHMASCEILSQQIRDYQTSLLAERRERQLLQNINNEINEELSNYTNEFNKIVAKATHVINERRTTHKTQNAQGSKLQSVFKEAELLLKVKQKKLTDTKTNYRIMQTDLKLKVEIVMDSISTLENEVQIHQEAYDREMPLFSEVKELCVCKIDEFAEMKNLIVEKKTNKTYLKAEVEQKQAKLKEMDVPKFKLRNTLQELGESHSKQLQEETSEVIDVEKKTCITQKKYAAIEIQNRQAEQERREARERKAINHFEEDMSFMRARMNAMHDGKLNVDASIGEYRDWLERQWRKHVELDKRYHAQDILLLDDIKRVELTTSQREKRIEDIHGRLEKQLNLLTIFIDKVADARPDIA